MPQILNQEKPEGSLPNPEQTKCIIMLIWPTSQETSLGWKPSLAEWVGIKV